MNLQLKMQNKHNMQREGTEKAARVDELTKINRGWYRVSLIYERTCMDDMQWCESTFQADCIAESGMDAYNKTIDHLNKDGEASFNAIYPDATSYDFEFFYLGMKTDNGYTNEPDSEPDSDLSSQYRLYRDGDRLIIEHVEFPRWRGEVTFGAESDIENVEFIDQTTDVMLVARTMREAGEYILKNSKK